MAIQKQLYPGPKAAQPELVLLAARVAIGGTGAVGTITGRGITVTRTGAGLYTVVIKALGNAVPDILFADIDVGFATGTNTQSAKILTISPSTATITIQTNDAGTVDVAADPPSGSFLLFAVIVQNLSQTT